MKIKNQKKEIRQVYSNAVTEILEIMTEMEGKYFPVYYEVN